MGQPRARVLVADSDIAARRARSDALRAAGFEVLEADDAPGALALLHRRPEVVVLDLLPAHAAPLIRAIRQSELGAGTAILQLADTPPAPAPDLCGADAVMLRPGLPPEVAARVGALLRVRHAEHRARQASRHWELTFDAIQDAIVLLDREGRILRCNQAFAESAGRPRGALLGLRFEACVARVPEGFPATPEAIGAVRARVRLDARCGDRWYGITLDPLPDGQGGLVAVIADVTERRRAELERERLLAENERQRHLLEAILESAPAGIAVIGGAERRVLLANPAFRELLPAPSRDPTGRRLEEVWPELGAGSGLDPYEQVAATGQPVRAEGQTLTRSDGAVRAISYQLRPLPWAGEPAALAVIWDTTALNRLREEAQAAAVAAEARAAELDAVLDSLADGLALVGADGGIRRANAAARRLFGAAMTVGGRLSQLNLEDAAGAPLGEQGPVRRALRGELVRGELVAVPAAPGRPVRWLSSSAAPILGWDGAVRGAVATFADVTRLRQLQEQGEDLLRMISHDLRTPLSALMMQAELLRRQAGQPERVLQRAGAILTSARRMGRMITDLVELVRIEGGQMELRQAPVALRDFALELLERLAGVLPEGRIEVAVPAGLEPVLADPDRLERILVNLLSNALKYSPPDEPIRLHAERRGEGICLEVSDRGPGIPEDELPRLFRRFFRARNAGRAEGLGLGLYITRLLVEAHGGRIWAESRAGAGSTFRVLLPVAHGAQQALRA